MMQVLLFRLGLVISISIWPSIGPLLTGLDTTWPRRLNWFPSRQKLAETMRPGRRGKLLDVHLRCADVR